MANKYQNLIFRGLCNTQNHYLKCKRLMEGQEKFDLILSRRDFEINQLIQRNNFFMLFQGVLLAGTIQSAHNKPIVSFLVCLCAVCVSIYQTQMAAGAKFWQEYWEGELHKVYPKIFHEDREKYRECVRERLG